MDIRKIPLEDLELLSYTDIAYELLKSDKKTKTTPALFDEVCKLLQIDENTMYEMIGDFYTTLTTDKRFILLDNAEWDLKENHKVKPIVDDEDEEEAVEEVDEAEESEDDAVSSDSEDYEEDNDDLEDLEDLAIVTEEEMEE